jgi:hypothetical protein
MKFILVLHLCSMLAGQCYESVHVNMEFKDHRSCALAGYEISGKSLEQLNPDRVNQEQLAVKFECRKIQNKPIIPLPKPGTPS